MVSFTKILKTVGMSMLVTLAAAKDAIQMKALVLASSSSDIEYIKLNFQSYGIPFDIIRFKGVNTIKGNLTLYDEDNEPKYNLVVINSGSLSFKVDNRYVSALSEAQWAYLEEYEAKNGVRRVVIEEDIYGNDTEIAIEDPDHWGTTNKDQPLIIDQSSEVKKIFQAAGVNTDAPLNINGIYHTRVKILNPTNTKPFLYVSDKGKKGSVVAAITTYPNGREKMHFYFGFGDWSVSSLVLNHVWLAWGTRSVYNGFRRVYFTPHIDDVFLSTELVDVKHDMEYSKYSEEFRTSRKDFEKIAKFQKDILKDMPEGSFYRVELAFNGNGMLINVDYDYALEVDGERYVDIEFVKEPGTGEKRWPKENYQFSKTQLNNFKKDDLFKYFANNSTAQKEFFWSSHTFSHENLDNAHISDVDNEIRLNIEVAKMLGLTDKEWWSGHAIITPQISGLHNKDALEIFEKYGIHSATGDLSRDQICNKENPYLPFYTTKKSSNYEGFAVIPRTPTEIYYFCSSREEDAWMFNKMYNSYYKRDLTWDEIAKSEADRTLLLMLKLRHEAHQFHQANLRSYPKVGNYGESLLEDWTRAVVREYTKYVNWPLISIKINRQAEVFFERAEREACGHQSKLILEGKNIVGVKVTATTGDCTVPVTVPGKVKESSLPKNAKLEQIGKDPLTVWVPLKKGESQTIELTEPIQWKIASTTATTKAPETTTTTTTTTKAPETTTTTTTTTVAKLTTKRTTKRTTKKTTVKTTKKTTKKVVTKTVKKTTKKVVATRK